MKNSDIEKQVAIFCEQCQGLNMIYDDYARSLGMPYTTLCILTMIEKTPGCTQKKICEKTFLPKQTVNAVITGFYKKGYIELRELTEDRRNKTIHLTEEGDKFAKKVIMQIRGAEQSAMAQLSEEQRKALIEGIKLYGAAFREAMSVK